MTAPAGLFSGAVLERMERPMKYTGARALQYEGIKVVRHQIGLPAYREAVKELNRLERDAQRKAAKREAAAAERERLRRIEEAKAEAARVAESEKKAKERAIRKAAAAKKKRAAEKISSKLGEVLGKAEVSLVIHIVYDVRRKTIPGQAPFEWKKGSQTIQAVTTHADQRALIKRKIDEWKNWIEQVSPIEVKNAKATVTQHTVVHRKPQALTNKKMKAASALDLDGGEIQSWDTGTDRCVFDFIIWRYGDMKGCKKICNYESLAEIVENYDVAPCPDGVPWANMERRVAEYKALELLDRDDRLQHEIFQAAADTPAEIQTIIDKLDIIIYNEKQTRISLEEHLTHRPPTTNPNPLKNGVDAFHCAAICDALKVRMYALDEEDNIIHTHEPHHINKNLPPLIFRVKNGHFYAILNRSTSIATTVSNKKRVSEMTHYKTAAEEKKETAEVEGLKFEVLTEGVESRVDQMIALMKKENKEIFDARNTHRRISYSDGKLVGFILNGVRYAWNEDGSITNAMKIAELNGVPYKGETTHSILMNLLDSLKYMEKRSACNPHTYRSIISENVKWRTHYGQEGGHSHDSLTAMVASGEAICVDIAKCYTSILENPMSDWFVYGFNDKWCPYAGELLPGLYFVKTEDMTLFHGSNIYSHTMVAKAVEEGIEHEVVAQCLPETMMPRNYFEPLLKAIDTTCKGDKDLKKSLTNIITGYLGKHESHKYFTKLNTDADTVWSDFAKVQFHENETFLQRSGDYYVYGYKQDFENSETNVPMYIQILDQSNIKLFDMIKASGGECLFRKTDCAVIRGGSVTYGTKNGDYRPSDVPLSIGLAKSVQERAVCPSIVMINEWTDHSEIISSTQDEAVFKILMEKGGVCVEGEAGTGKSYLALGVEELHKAKFPEGKVIKLAFTNKAALNFGGKTIHKFLKMDSKGRFNLTWLKPLRGQQVLIEVDEISMIGAFIWRRLAELKKALPDARFLLLGHSWQCEPVEENPIDYFNSSVVKYIAHFQRVELTVTQRYDIPLRDFVRDVYLRENTDYAKIMNIPAVDVAALATTTNICYFNKTRKILNERINQHMGALQAMKIDAPFVVEDKEKDYSQQDAILYKGLPIIAHKNFSRTVDGVPELMCVNSEAFVIQFLSDELLTAVSMRPEGEHSFSIKPSEFHDFFLLNYCSTTHKQQGATIDGSIVIFDYWAMSQKIRYTALTRVKRLDQVGIFRGNL